MPDTKPKFLDPSQLAERLTRDPQRPSVAGDGLDAEQQTARPAFLDPQRAESIGYVEAQVEEAYRGGPDRAPDFAPWDNHAEPDPEARNPLKPRHRELARLHALGKTNKEICQLLGYSTNRVSYLINNPVVRREVDRYRNRLFDRDLATAIKDLGYDSIEVLERMLRSDDAKLRDRVDAAKWVLEKISGKPRQEVTVESQSLNRFFDLLQDLRDRGETLDVTPMPSAGPQDTATSPPAQLTGSRFDSVVDGLFDDEPDA